MCISKLGRSFKVRVCIVGLIPMYLFPRVASGATVKAASAAAIDVQNAINSAASGDTVLLPASSSATWNSGISIANTKGITLNGNGCTIGRGSSSIALVSIYNNVTASTRVTGFSFNQTTADHIFEIRGSFSNAKFRIDHCTLRSSSGNSILVVIETAWGLIDHCTITADDSSEMIHNEAYGATSTTGWTVDIDPDGTGQGVYIEDCTFSKYNQSTPYYWGTSAIQSYYGAITVLRHCLLNYCQIDQHGTAGAIGARWWEVYACTNHIPSGGANQSDFIVMRAGSGVIYSNYITGGPNGGTGGITLLEEDSGYPALYQIGRGKSQVLDPAYCWANPVQVVSGSANVVDGRDFYSNTVKPGYVPYPYPHPLIAATDGNAPPVVNVSATPTNGPTPLTVSFSSSGSFDPEGASLTYSWAFGDGSTSTLANPTNAYQTDGTYFAQLTVSDGTNSTKSTNIRITVGTPPAPPSGLRVVVGP